MLGMRGYTALFVYVNEAHHSGIKVGSLQKHPGGD
jgi:hypothetical protein